MKLHLITLEKVLNGYEALVRCGGIGAYGFGDTPLKATRRAWQATQNRIANMITRELRKR